ncbi:MAG: ABC transporter permease, partial [Actinomycetota bacterium]|nr:ABC transporter permease [Actinomycetota bacterium]
AFMINTMNQDYVRTARAKGIGESKVLVGHAFRATAAPLLTLVGLDLAVQMGGAVFTEAIFQLPGMGLLALNSLGTSDLPTIAGVVVVTSIIVVLGNLIVDLLYVVVDPRVSLA